MVVVVATIFRQTSTVHLLRAVGKRKIGSFRINDASTAATTPRIKNLIAGARKRRRAARAPRT